MKVGDKYRQFTVKKSTKIDEINVHVTELTHDITNSDIIHISANDDENLFSLTFKTYPKNNSGAPHILEHTTLCGSKKYNVHDPFFLMLRRSSNTFMNAFTSTLWTSYLASSKIEKDFYNLLEVYLDACFNPLLTKEAFQQEGHRLSFEKENDPSSDLVIKGVVYNEMKGVFSNPLSIFFRKLTAGLCSDSVYGLDSGGIPEEIPNLTYDDLISFHKEYYHPSRCIFFFYGNIPIEKHIDFIGEKILDNAIQKQQIPNLPKQKRFTKPKRESSFYPSHDKDTSNKTIIGFAYLTADIEDQNDLLALALIDSILMDTDASLLKYKLINSGFCINVDSHYDPYTKDVPYSIICTGCASNDADRLEMFLYNSLKEIASQEIPAEMIEGALYQLEFSRSEMSSDAQPYAIDLWWRTVLSYIQGGSLLDGLKIHSLFETLHELIKQPNYLSNIIKKYFIDNQHMYRLSMSPDLTLAEKIDKDEKEHLEKKKKSLSKQEIDEILKESRKLKKYQKNEKNEDTSCLPILSLNDIPKNIEYYPITRETYDGLDVYHHNCFTNQIIYADIVFDLPQIDEKNLQYLRLLVSILTELGSGNRNYIENLNYINRHIGDVWTNLSLNVQREDTKNCYPTISLSGKSLSKKSRELFQIMQDFILSADLQDGKRIKELVVQSYTELQQQLNSQAIGYAIKQSAASFSSWNHISNIWYGLPYYKFIENLAKNVDEELPFIIEKFEELFKSIFHLNNPHLLLSCSDEIYQNIKNNNFFQLNTLAKASGSFHPWVELPNTPVAMHEGKILASTIAHNVQSIHTITIVSNKSAPLKLATYILENTQIHNLVREIGGAYSSGVKYNILTGNYQFFSSRDPNILETYKSFQRSVENIANGDFTDQDLHEAKLNYIQDVDAVVPPGMRASITYFQHKVGLTKEVRQAFRDQILLLTKDEVVDAVSEHLLPKMKLSSVRVSYASKDLFKQNTIMFDKENFPQLAISDLYSQ